MTKEFMPLSKIKLRSLNIQNKIFVLYGGGIMITKKEILKCQKLLHEDYHGAKIKLYGSRLSLILRRMFVLSFSEILSLLHEDSPGWYNPNNEEVHILLFKFGKDDLASVNVIYTLYHELRHYYQFKHKPRLVKRRDWTIRTNEPGYSSDSTERDANKFAARMCKKYIREISEIVDTEPDWIVEGYP